MPYKFCARRPRFRRLRTCNSSSQRRSGVPRKLEVSLAVSESARRDRISAQQPSDVGGVYLYVTPACLSLLCRMAVGR